MPPLPAAEPRPPAPRTGEQEADPGQHHWHAQNTHPAHGHHNAEQDHGDRRNRARRSSRTKEGFALANSQASTTIAPSAIRTPKSTLILPPSEGEGLSRQSGQFEHDQQIAQFLTRGNMAHRERDG